MRYLNSKLCALLALCVSLVAVPGLGAQDAPAPLRGDVDGDGRVTRADADAVRAYLVRGTLPGGRSILPAGDANGDGRVTAADAALISRFAAGVDVSRFPVGRPVENGRGEPGGGTLRTGDQFCTADVREKTITCREVLEGGAGSQNVILGTPFVTFVTSTTYSDDNTGEDTANYSVRIRNATPQPLGTTDGTTLAAGGIRLFFNNGPTVVASTGGATSIRLETPDGTATFTNQNGSATYTNKAYFQYNEVLAPADTTDPRSMRFIYSSNVTSFSFTYRVSAPAQYEHGWVTVAPASVPVLAPGETASLTGTVYNQVGQQQGDGITWSSSDMAVATVDASTGLVTAVAEGTTTITATSTVNNQRTGSRPVTVDQFPSVASTTPTNGATGVLVTGNIVINFSEAVNVTGSAFTLECPAGASQAFTVSGNGTSAITLNPDADLPAAVTCTVNVDGNEVTDVDTNDGPNLMPGNYSFSFETAIQAIGDVFGTTTTGNVRINSASTSPVFSVTTNDKTTGATTITFAGWNAVAGKTMGGGDVVMDTEGADMGTFTYNPPAGFEGTDSLEYTITSGTASSSAKVALPVSGMIWFVNNGGAACTTRASGCGRLTNPYSSLAAFNAENNGTGNNPAAGDAAFLYESASSYTGPVTLLANQKLIGQDAGASLSTITGINPATGSDPLPSMNPGSNTVTIAGASGGVVLGADNLLRGFSLATTGGTALSGTGFGTPTMSEVPISATGGAALSLDNGTLNSTFPSVSSTNSTGRGISLTNVNGSPTFTAGSISGAAQAAFLVNGGNVSFTWPGTIDQRNNAPLVHVSGHENAGVLTFSGSLIAKNGTGLQFSDADGTYTFSGTTALTDSVAVSTDSVGIDITNGSQGTFTFDTGTTITNPSGPAFNLYGSTASVTYRGSISKASAGNVVEIGEHSAGTVTFETGTLSATAGTGIQLSNADGIYNFAGTTTLNGGDAGIDIIGGSGGTFAFSAGTSVGGTTSPTGTAFTVNGSTPNVTFNGNLTKSGTSTGLLVDITNQASGTITFQTGTLSSTSSNGTGIQLSSANGTVNFNGTTTLSNGNNGVDVIGGSTGTITFASGTAITNPSGAALFVNASAPANLTFAGGISTNGAASRPVHIQGLTGGSVTVSGSVTATGLGILLQDNTPTTGSSSIGFTGARTLNTAGNAAVTLDNNDNATVSFGTAAMTINTTGGEGFRVVNGGTVNVTGTANDVTSTTGVAVRISDSNVGGSGVRFRSVSANGAPNGIFLSATGNTGGSFRVDGTGSVGSGGSILSTVGNDGETSGNGVYLNNVRNVVLTGMIINNHPNHGILGQTVTGFTLDNSRLAGTHGTNVGFDEAVISITGLGGQAVFSNDSISGGIEDNVRILNHGIVSAATDSILFNNVRMGHVNSASGNTALLVRVADGSNNRVRIRNSTFHGSRGGSTFHLNVVNTATARLALNQNTFHNTQTQISGAGGVLITASGTAASVPTLTYNITNNSFRGSRTVALNINKDVGQAVINGNISNNVIGDAGITNSGSSEASGIQLRHQGGGTHRATVTNNQIFQYNNYGIILEAGDAVAGGGHGRMDMTVTGNTVSNPGTLAFTWNGLHANIGTVTDDAHILCLAATGNSMDNSGTAGQDIRLRQRMKTTIILPGYGSGASDNTAVNNFVKANNGNGAGLVVVASNSIGVAAPNGPGNGFLNGSCNAPTF